MFYLLTIAFVFCLLAFIFFFFFVCLALNVPLENLSLIRRHLHYGRKGLQILILLYWHSWPLSSEGSWACHTYCLLWWSPKTCDTHTSSGAFSSGAITTCFSDLGLSRLGFEHPAFRMRDERPNRLCHCSGKNKLDFRCYVDFTCSIQFEMKINAT